MKYEVFKTNMHQVDGEQNVKCELESIEVRISSKNGWKKRETA